MEKLSSDTNYNEATGGRDYQVVLKILKKQGFNFTMSEASILRQVTKEVQDETKGLDEESIKFNIEKEIVYRFFWRTYGINLRDHLDPVNMEQREEVLKDLIKYAQEKLRKDSELI